MCSSDLLNQAQRNAQDSISLLQTAEGALNETHSILARMRELAVQSANDTLTTSDRLHIQDEVNQLLSEVDRIGNATQFNTIALFNAAATGGRAGLTFHVGANFETGNLANELQFTIGAAGGNALASPVNGTINTNTLGVNGLDVSGSQAVANTAIATLDTAIEDISTFRGAIGAMQNRLASTINSLGVAAENTGAANSRIRDADVASAVSEMVRSQILQQSTMAVLAQANQAPQMALQLLK